jgi:uracil-DNA glycosylase
VIDRGLLAQYFRQLAELGIDELVLDGLSPEEAVALLGGRAAPAVPARAAGRGGATQAVPARPTGRMTARDLAAAAGLAEVDDPRPAAALLASAASAAPAAPAAPPLSPAHSAPAALPTLAADAATCVRCGLHASRTNVVFGEGNATAELVVVGEAPGQEEDRSGRPFVGRAGRLLDLLLMTAGFPRESVYICNVLKCRPPNNRNPQPDEVTACTTSFLHGQLEAIAPRVLLAVGRFAAQALLQSEESIGRLRGVIHSYRGTPLIVTYHPAFLLRSPQMTRVAWQDFQMVRRVLDEQARD